MRAEHVCLVALALSSLAAQAAELAALPPPTGIGIERGVVLVRCRAPTTTDPRLLLAHSCVSYPGTSGSPLVVAIERERSPVLIGIHVGTQLTWTGTKLDFVSVARPLDAAVAAAIEAAADRAAVPERRKRRLR
jgi:hypothetical protein